MKKINERVVNRIFQIIGENQELPKELKNEIKVLLSKNFRTQKNFFLLTDLYKQTHWMQTPRGTTEIYSYYENRYSAFPKQLFFGLSFILQEYLEGQVVEQWMIDEAKEDTNAAAGYEYFNIMGAERILKVHGGRLPLEIKALPEGSLVETGNALFTIRNTDKEIPFLTNYVESILMQVYSTIGTATLSFYIRKCAEFWANKTGAVIHDFFINDFGFRGASSVETAEKNGGAHLLVFKGSDNQSAQKWLRDFYDAPNILGSVFASEHSTTTIWGRNGEKDALRMWLTIMPDDAILSVVIDSYNYKKYITEVMGDPEIKHLILNRKGKVIARPDSGVPHLVSVKVLDLLAATFGFSISENGEYKILNPKVGMIYGDGINYHSINLILQNIVEAGYCVSNVIFGMGGALLQQINRDTHGVAIKCSNAIINGENIEVYKDPIDSSKKSKKGKMITVQGYAGEFRTLTTSENKIIIDGSEIISPTFYSMANELKTVFLNGEIIIKPTYKEIHKRIQKSLKKESSTYYGIEKTV